MKSSEYQKLYNLETTYWWHVGRRHILETLLRKNTTFLASNETQPNSTEMPLNLKLIDVGCGTGENIKFLSRFGKITGIDASKQAIEFCKKRGLENIQISRVEDLPFGKDSFDFATMLDLLEHVEEDLLALKKVNRVLKPGGSLLITVPSHNFLWSEHDEALNHKRRYSKKELRSKVEKSGLIIKRLSFAITILFLPIILYRLFQNIFIKTTTPRTSYIILPDWLNEFFIDLLKFEAWLLRYIDLPFGVSLICVAEKVKDSQ